MRPSFATPVEVAVPTNSRFYFFDTSQPGRRTSTASTCTILQYYLPEPNHDDSVDMHPTAPRRLLGLENANEATKHL